MLAPLSLRQLRTTSRHLPAAQACGFGCEHGGSAAGRLPKGHVGARNYLATAKSQVSCCMLSTQAWIDLLRCKDAWCDFTQQT